MSTMTYPVLTISIAGLNSEIMIKSSWFNCNNSDSVLFNDSGVIPSTGLGSDTP